ncbi:MAG: pyruvate/oxaloacetate carboxyltransferase [Clostridia bacterium]|nr:pyruvate/oxaloacetate carboxyltransferase [Clostridia bacterium]
MRQAVGVQVTDTTLRDGQQSLLATRMATRDMLPIAAKMDAVGFRSVEVWGGATFDSCLRYLKEDPWARLRQLRSAFTRTPLQMLLRGQNLVGYEHYPDDVVEAFVRCAHENGIRIFRIFDALNDVRNMQKAISVARGLGAHVQATISYTISPVHHPAYYVRVGLALKEMGAHSLCIKDMAGIITPVAARTLVRALKEEVGLPVQLHCHYSSGLASMAYWEAVHAGVDVVDTAISSMALGSSQPPCESLVVALQGTPYDTGLDVGLLAEIAGYFRDVRQRYKEFDVGSAAVDINVLNYQIPGGMISNFVAQLTQLNALEKLPQVLAEVPRVREDLGYPPLVTPTSQIVGTQAVFNVLGGERYRICANETKAYLRGLYGQPPGPVNEEVRRKVIGGQEVITCRPADLLAPRLEQAREEIKDLARSEEDVLSYCLFPTVAKEYLAWREAN